MSQGDQPTNSNLYTPYLFGSVTTNEQQVPRPVHPFIEYSAQLLPPPTPRGVELLHRKPLPASGLVMSSSIDDSRTGSVPSTSGHSDSPGTGQTSATSQHPNTAKRPAPTSGELHSDKSCRSISLASVASVMLQDQVQLTWP